MGSRILLADDSITIQKVVNLTFADEGIEVFSVSNGDMAERRLREIDPDLVLADIFMPGKNGYELCETIKKNPQFRNVPVVLLVGAFEPFNEVEARRVQADAHLTKPFESRLLVETVRTLIEKNPHARVATAPLPKRSSSAPLAEPDSYTPNSSAVKVPPFNLDMEAMGAPPASDSAFADRASLAQAADSTPFVDSFPSSFAPTTPPTQTIEFASELAPTHPDKQRSETTLSYPSFDQGGVSPSKPSPMDVELPPFDQTINGGGSGFQVADFDAAPALDEALPSLAESPANVVVDFDQVESWEETAPDHTVSFDVEADNPIHDNGEITAAIAHSSLETRKLDTNELLEEQTVKLAEDGSDLGATSKDFAFYESTESATTLLKSEEPLGDVLSNSLPQAPYDLTAKGPAPLELDEPVSRTPADETAAETTIVADASQGTEFTSYRPEVVTPEEAQTAAPTVDAEQAVAVEMPSDLTPTPEEVIAEESEAVAGESLADSQAVGFPAPDDNAELAAEAVEESPVTAAEMSTEEPQFTPVSLDITSPIEASIAEQTEFASAREGAGVEMSSEMMNEIVRRVVAQLSDQVVREVAWEVVPDCVERIISSLTREELEKRK